MLDGTEILEMWGDALLDSVATQQQAFQAQLQAVQELSAQLQRPDKLGPLNPALRFFDWDNLPAFQKNLQALPADTAAFYQHCLASWFVFVTSVTHKAFSPRR